MDLLLTLRMGSGATGDAGPPVPPPPPAVNTAPAVITQGLPGQFSAAVGTWSGMLVRTGQWWANGGNTGDTGTAFDAYAHGYLPGQTVFYRETAFPGGVVQDSNSLTIAGAINTAPPVVTQSSPGTFNCTTGVWTGATPPYARQWYRNDVAIAGQTSSTLLNYSTGGATGDSITCKVTAQPGNVTVTSNAVISTAPAGTISGTPFPGKTLTSTAAGQWQANGVDIPGETGTTYVVKIKDVGQPIKQGGSNTLVIWHPASVTNIRGCWVGWSSALSSVGPDVPAAPGATVRQWKSISGSPAALDQTVGTQQPTFAKDAIGPGVDMLHFDGVNDIMACTEGGVRNVTNQPFEWTILSTARTVISVDENGLFFTDNTALTGTGVTGGTNNKYYRLANSTSTEPFITAPPINATYHVQAGKVRIGEEQALYFDAAVIPERKASVTPAFLSTHMNLGGSDYAGGQGAFLPAYVGCVIVGAGPTDISDADFRRLRQYAGLCSGLDLGLSVLDDTITGTPFPGKTLTSTAAGQWRRNGVNISGQTGATYVVQPWDIGAIIDQPGSTNSKVIWKPADVAGVFAFWVPWLSVLNAVGPDTPAADGQTVRRWGAQITTGHFWEQSSGASQPIYRADFFGTGLHGVQFDGVDDWLLADSALLNFTAFNRRQMIVCSRPTGGVAATMIPISFWLYGGAGNNIGINIAPGPTASVFDTGMAATTAALAGSTHVLSGRTAAAGAMSIAGNAGGYVAGGPGTGGVFSSMAGALGGYSGPTYLDKSTHACVLLYGGDADMSALNDQRLRQFAGLCGGIDLGLSVT